MYKVLDANPILIGFLVFVGVVFGIVAIVLPIVIPITVTHKKYENFVLEHSVAIRNLKEINTRYVFKYIPNYDLEHSYDNENFYGDISPKDYLTYQLVFLQKKVNQCLKDALVNKEKYDSYIKEVREKCHKGTYDVDPLPNQRLLEKYEYEYYDDAIEKPTVSFSIYITLKLTNINGVFIKAKHGNFGPKEIKDTIFKINQKRNGFYLNEEIWKSICRVERGKVTNKMRFAIYERDGYRCRICKRKTNDLEVDHIIPIAKGGKSTYDNLQTLCHRCNVKKGASLDY